MIPPITLASSDVSITSISHMVDSSAPGVSQRGGGQTTIMVEQITMDRPAIGFHRFSHGPLANIGTRFRLSSTLSRTHNVKVQWP